MSQPTRILLCEDDLRLAELTRDFLNQQGFEVIIEGRGDKVLSRLTRKPCALVILDLSLPGKDGIDVCRALKNAFNTPIIMLTARDQTIDQIIGLEAGADDYICKPVDPMLLLARIRSQLRRQATPTPKNSLIKIGSLTINPTSRQVTLACEAIQLTNLEFDLLTILATHAGTIISRDQLHLEARGIDYDGLDRSVDIRISHLRKKLHDDLKAPTRIKAIWGKGYLLAPDAWA